MRTALSTLGTLCILSNLTLTAVAARTLGPTSSLPPVTLASAYAAAAATASAATAPTRAVAKTTAAAAAASGVYSGYTQINRRCCAVSC
ncbi:unnamed protein product [Closterium sp. NIES-54]